MWWNTFWVPRTNSSRIALSPNQRNISTHYPGGEIKIGALIFLARKEDRIA